MSTCFTAPPLSPLPPSGGGIPQFTCEGYITPQFGQCAKTCTDAEFSAFLAFYVDVQVTVLTGVNITGVNITGLDIYLASMIAQISALKTCKLSKDPCFPSEALITMADGTPRPLSALRAGDAIVAASADGTLTTDTVSLLSLADADVPSTTFVVLTTASGRSLTLTPTHHVPVGAACCADLKQAKDIAVGETVYELAMSTSKTILDQPGEAVVSASAAVRSTQVMKIGTAIKPGLHSPVLSHGTMPIVNGVVTSFDELHNVRLASYGLPLLEAAGLTATFRDAFLRAHRKYMV